MQALMVFISCYCFLSVFMLSQAQDCFFIIKDKEGALRRRQAVARWCYGHDKKRILFTPLCQRGMVLFGAKVPKALRAYPMQPYPQANSQNTATTGLAHLKTCANKINAFPIHRLSIAVFLSVAGYGPVRAIKVSVGLRSCNCLRPVG